MSGARETNNRPPAANPQRDLYLMISKRRLLLWLVLSLPAAAMVFQLLGGSAPSEALLHPSGEMSIRLMILALVAGPISEFVGLNWLLRGWLSIRRNLGVASFAYGILHLIFYMVDLKLFALLLADLPRPAIWTGWFGLVALTIPAAISFDAAARRLGQQWRKLQLLVYPAFILAILHWVLLDWAWLPATVHVLPVLIAWCLRAAARRGYRLPPRKAVPGRSTG